MNKACQHTHGSPEVWREEFRDVDLSYSETPSSQGKLFELVKTDFLKEIFPPPPKTMLEVGCGTGYVSLFFAKRGYRVTCLDINAFILKIAKKNFIKEGAKGKFMVGNAESLSFKDNTFDIVTSFGLLEHFGDPQTAIDEMVRVLKKGGVFFADVVPNRFSCQTVGNILNSLSVLVYWSLKGSPLKGIHKALRHFRPEYFENSISWVQYKCFMEKAGLKNVSVRGNRPFPRLTLPQSVDKVYVGILKPFRPLWKIFDRWDNWFPRFWGAGLWFWGYR